MRAGRIEEEGTPDFMFGPDAGVHTREFLSQINN
jgi:ABC-type histidine transport system ATPase subunit